MTRRNDPRRSPNLSAVLGGVADRTRRDILEMLRSGEQTAGRIAEAFPVSRPAISRHLRVLRQARLVRETRRGRLRVYRLDAAPLAQIEQWLTAYRAHWAARLVDLKEFVEKRAVKE